MRARRAGLGAALVMAAGCHLGPPPREIPLLRPLHGPVAVLPAHDGTDHPEVAAALAVASESAIRGRGYYVAPTPVVAALLERHGGSRERPPYAEDFRETAAELGLGALVQIDVRRWRGVWAPTLLHLDYEVVWRIVDVESGETAWRRRVADRWSWETELPVLDHEQVMGLYLGRRLEEEPQSPFRDVVDVARQMARGVFRSLPAAARPPER